MCNNTPDLGAAGGEVTEGELARFLRCEDDPFAVRKIVQECLTSLELASGGETLSVQLDFQRSLLSHAS